MKCVDIDSLEKGNFESLSTLPSSSDLKPRLPENSFYYDFPNYYRWVILTGFIFMSVFTGATFMNWPPLYQMFHWSNAYAYLCHPSDLTYESRDHGEIYCDAKELSISAMLPAAASTMYAFDIVAGVVLDCFGGKVCTIFGVSSQIVGWTMIGLSGVSFHGYLPGMIMIAIGVDPTFYGGSSKTIFICMSFCSFSIGLLSVANLFPGWSSTILSVLSAARSVAYGNVIVMKAISNNRDNIQLGEISLIFAGLLGFWLLFTIFFVPLHPYPKVPPGASLQSVQSEGKPTYKEWLRRKPQVDFHLFTAAAKTQMQGFSRYALTMPYAALCFLPIISFIRNIYYGVSFKEHLPNAAPFYTIVNPLSLLPCPFLGILADRVSTALMIALLSVCGCLSMLLVMFKVVALEYLSVSLNFIFIAFSSSQFYIYIAYGYPQEQMGKLAGFCVLLGGLASLSVTPMFNFSMSIANFFPMDLVVVVRCFLSTISFVPLGLKFLFFQLLQVCAIAICIFLYLTFERPIRREAATSKAATMPVEKAS